MKKISEIARRIIRSHVILLLAITVSLAIVSAFTYDVEVPGDLDGDLIVSDGELEAAQSSHEDGDITSEELEKIEQINEDYPRTIIDMAGREVTLYKPVERIITTNPDGTRMVIALGAGDLIVGTDSASATWGGICPTINESTEEEQPACKECHQEKTCQADNKGAGRDRCHQCAKRLAQVTCKAYVKAVGKTLYCQAVSEHRTQEYTERKPNCQGKNQGCNPDKEYQFI